MTGDRENAFDLLRLVLAGGVVWTHACLLGGFETPFETWLFGGQTNLGTLAVLGFFGLSGFLVARSFTSDPSLRRFFARRARRILPGFYVCLIVTAFFLAPLIGHVRGMPSAWSLSEAFAYIQGNVFLHIGKWTIGTLLAGLPHVGSINGSLWSLFPEACCYIALAVLGIGGFLGRHRVQLVLAGMLLFFFHAAILFRPDSIRLAPTLLALTGNAPFAVAFSTGVLARVFRDELGLGPRPALTWGVLALVTLKFGGWSLAGPVIFPLLLLQVAHWRRITLPFDFSYGLYIYHFPLLQLLASLGLHRGGLALFFGLGLMLSLAVAALSWFWVERPFLRRADARPSIA